MPDDKKAAAKDDAKDDADKPPVVVPDTSLVDQAIQNHADLLQKQSDVILAHHTAIQEVAKDVDSHFSIVQELRSVIQAMHDRIVSLENHIKRIGL